MRVRESIASTPPAAKSSSLPVRRDRERLGQFGAALMATCLDTETIQRHQSDIHSQTMMLSRTIDGPNFSRVADDDLSRMVAMYDERFFGGELLPLVRAEGIQFSFSSRLTSAAGKMITEYPNGYDGPRRFHLRLSSTLLFQTFSDVSRKVEVTGRLCRDRLEAMQRVAEHELVHLVEMLVFNDGDCNQPRFQSIARRYFGHTDYRHDLMTQRERAARKFNIRVGDRVRFRNDDRTRIGRVNRITRRATVLVPDRRGQRFSDGGTYLKFYVPLEKLEKI